MTPSREKAAEELWSDICGENVLTRIALPLIIKALESAYREGLEKSFGIVDEKLKFLDTLLEKSKAKGMDTLDVVARQMVVEELSESIRREIK